ncbi:MAG: FtsX-like permease family protein [Aridibacter sp.]
MSFEFKLAWKYFRSRRKSLVRFTSIIAIVGIAAGVASLIIAQAIASGFSNEMRDKVLNNTSHITIFDESNTNFSNPEIITEKIKQIENVESVLPTTYESAVISSKENSSYAVLRVESKKQSKVQSPKSKVQISLGKELAEKLKLNISDEAEIITLENSETPQNSKVFVADIFETGLYEYDSTWIFVDERNYLKLKNLQKFSPKIFSVSVKDIYKVDKTAVQIRHALGKDFKVLDWQEANKPLFAALSLEKKAALAVILLIIFIASLNITTTLSLLVNERKTDIAILRTCGAKTKNLVTIFLFEGIILSLIGIISGVILGLFICFLGNYFKIISLSKEVYSLNYIPFRVDFLNVLLVISLTFLLCLLAIIYPVLKASRIKPLEIFRTQ